MLTLSSPIKSISVQPNNTTPNDTPPPEQTLKPIYTRPDYLPSYTYRIKPPNEPHALYITITHSPETLDLAEVFINTKNPDHYQWVIALTRLISATFRAKVPISVIIQELRQIYSPTGGYFAKGGTFHPSLIAEIGHIIALEHQRLHPNNTASTQTYPKSATTCPNCLERSLITLDGCPTCLACGYSKCS